MHAEKPCVCKYFRVVWHIILLLLCERIILSYEDFVDCKYEYIFSPHDPIWRKRIYWLETHAYIWHSDITSLLFSKSKRSLFLVIKILKRFDTQFKFWCLIFLRNRTKSHFNKTMWFQIRSNHRLIPKTIKIIFCLFLFSFSILQKHLNESFFVILYFKT